MALSGNVETLSLVSLFQFLAQSSATGRFRVSSEDGFLELRLCDGTIYIAAHSTAPTCSLYGILWRDRPELASELASSPLDDDASLGRRLIESGALDALGLVAARRAQLEEQLLDIFSWRRARFDFVPEELPPGLQTLRANGLGDSFMIPQLLLEAARRQDTLDHIQTMIPSSRMLYTLAEGRASEVTESLAQLGVEVDAAVFNGRSSVEELLEGWRSPRTLALSRLAQLVESGALCPLAKGESLRRFRDLVEIGALRACLKDLSYLLESEQQGPGSMQSGLELELIDAPAYASFRGDANWGASLHGPRVYRLLAQLLAKPNAFTMVLREDGREKRIVRSRQQISIASTDKGATPRILHYLRRIGAITASSARSLWTVSSRELYKRLVVGGRVARAQWLQALAEKVAEELAELFFWSRPQLEVFSRPEGVSELRRPVKMTLALDDDIRRYLLRRLDEFSEMARVVPSRAAIFKRSHPRLPVPHSFYRKFDGHAPLQELVGHARAGPIEFLRFVCKGVRKRVLRSLTGHEMVQGIEGALARGDHRRARRLAACLFSFGAHAAHGELLEQVEREAGRLELDVSGGRLIGDLADFSLAEVLQTLWQGGYSGTLTLTDGEREQIFYFYNGVAHLLRSEDDEADDDFLELFGEQGAPQDLRSNLLQGFDLSPEEIGEAELAAIKEQTLNVFFWSDAGFEFRRNELPDLFWSSEQSGGGYRVALDTQLFLLEVLGKLRELDDIREDIPSEKVVLSFVSLEHKMRAMALGSFPELVMIIDGRRDLEQLSRVWQGSRFELYRFLHGLLKEGALTTSVP